MKSGAVQAQEWRGVGGTGDQLATRNLAARRVCRLPVYRIDERKRAEENQVPAKPYPSSANSLAQQMTHCRPRRSAGGPRWSAKKSGDFTDLVAVFIIDEATGISTRTAAAGFRTEVGRRKRRLLVARGHRNPAVAR